MSFAVKAVKGVLGLNKKASTPAATPAATEATGPRIRQLTGGAVKQAAPRKRNVLGSILSDKLGS